MACDPSFKLIPWTPSYASHLLEQYRRLLRGATQLSHLAEPRGNPSVGALTDQKKPGKGGISHMATESRWTVYVPDRTEPFYFQTTLTAEEVRGALESTGYPSVRTAEMVINAQTITFRRPSGGTKGF